MRGAYRIGTGCLLLLGLMVGCGGGNGADEEALPGAYWTGVDITTAGCGAEVHDEVGGDVSFPEANRIRLTLYLVAAGSCGQEEVVIEGTQTGPTTWDMDNVEDGYACMLDSEYGYQYFDLAHGTITQEGTDYRLQCAISAESGAAVCTGLFHLYMQTQQF